MHRRSGFITTALAAILPLAAFAPAFIPKTGLAQNVAGAPNQGARKVAPAPPRDLSGIWEPVSTIQGIAPSGANNMPADGKPEHELSFTPYGLQLARRNKSSNGPNQVPSADENDPAHLCDPQGFPREELFELRATEIVQNPSQVLMLYTYNRVWRVIWKDGRKLPKDPDPPKWYGYSVGRWKDDTTFVAETNGTDARTWLDNAGRPHSEDLRVEEVFHRIDHGHMELSMTIDDPKVYTKPWRALNKMQFRLKPSNFEPPEMMCSPSELAEYNRRFAGKAAVKK